MAVSWRRHCGFAFESSVDEPLHRACPVQPYAVYYSMSLGHWPLCVSPLAEHWAPCGGRAQEGAPVRQSLWLPRIATLWAIATLH